MKPLMVSIHITPPCLELLNQSEPPPICHKQLTPTCLRKEIPTPDQLWIPKFDGSKSKLGSGVGFELKNLKGKTYFASYKLQFGCTNNVADYEALAKGLMFAHQKKVIALTVMGDSEVIIK